MRISFFVKLQFCRLNGKRNALNGFAFVKSKKTFAERKGPSFQKDSQPFRRGSGKASLGLLWRQAGQEFPYDYNHGRYMRLIAGKIMSHRSGGDDDASRIKTVFRKQGVQQYFSGWTAGAVRAVGRGFSIEIRPYGWDCKRWHWDTFHSDSSAPRGIRAGRIRLPLAISAFGQRP